MADEMCDVIIEKLLAVRDKKPSTTVQLTNDEGEFIVVESKRSSKYKKLCRDVSVPRLAGFPLISK